MPVRWILQLMVLVLAVASAQADASAAGRPNLIFLMADDQSTYSLGCYGTPDVKTPHLDQLSRDGITFDNHYDTTAICMASRASVMTGLLEYRHGCNFDHGPLLRKHWRASYPALLREAGYRTGFAGKFGFVVADRAGDAGSLPADEFDRWGGGPGQTFYATKKNPSMVAYAERYPHSTLAYGAFACDFIRQSADDTRPFCLSISFKAPHRPATPDPQFDAIYRGHSFTKPANFGRQNGRHLAPQSRLGRQYERFHSWHYSDDYDRVMATYHQQIYAIDVAVGRIRQALDAAGVADDTVILYTSDNGFMCGAHGYGSKVLPYEEASRVPLLYFDPRLPKPQRGLRCDALTGNIDIAPTLLRLAGLAAPEGIDGRSLTTLVGNPEAAIHTALPLINVWGPRPVHSLAIVTRDWKYIYWPYNGQGYHPVEELYHTAVDPLELENQLANPNAESTLRQLRRRYDEQVTTWQQNAVAYHNYQPFGSTFTRRDP